MIPFENQPTEIPAVTPRQCPYDCVRLLSSGEGPMFLLAAESRFSFDRVFFLSFGVKMNEED